MMNKGSNSRSRSVAALIHAVARKNALRLIHDPIVILKSQYFSIGWEDEGLCRECDRD